MKKLSETLRERGYVYQTSSETLEEITDGPKRVVYLGVDPTADSIHAGNLVAYMLLRRFADAGHKIILLIGGGTGMIGDPKPDVERPLTPPEVVAERAVKLKQQAERVLGGVEVEVVNNYDWLSNLDLLGFLRDIGKHFTVNGLIKKDAISTRLGSEEGISYTEFTYPLLQAYDFWHLFTEKNCDVQIGGSDQWGNITAGVDLIRRKESKSAYGLTLPLVVDKATGKKFGKSEGNAIWLDAEKTSPYEFYQFWLNTSDESAVDYLKLFTLLSDEDISAIAAEHAQNPGMRSAQKRLAHEVTALIHGAEEAGRAERVSEILFGEAGQGDIDVDTKKMLASAAPTVSAQEGMSIADALVAASLASSKREARQFLEDGAVTINGEKAALERTISANDFQNGVALLKRGKRNVCVLRLSR